MCTPRTLSLFIGAGGLDLGLEAAGFELAVAVEYDRDAVGTIAANPERGWRVIGDDIHRVSSVRLMEHGEIGYSETDLLVGGPPCQPFSKSGFWASGEARRLKDPRAATLDAYFRVLEDVAPKAFLLENVPGLRFNNKSEGFELIRDRLDRINNRLGTRYSM